MAKKLWQVWTENDAESAWQGHIVDEKILKEGTETECRKFAKTIPNAHLGYNLDGTYLPERGDIWKGVFYDAFVIQIKKVSSEQNLVRAKIVQSKNPDEIGKVLDYMLDTFHVYYILG